MSHRWSIFFLWAAIAASQPGPRWLAFCDKRTAARVGTIAWEDAPMRTDLRDSLVARGWKIRTEYRWGNRLSAVGPDAESPLPACVQDVGPVGRGQRSTPIPVVAARTSGATGVDPATQALQKIWNEMGIEAVQQNLLLRGKKAGSGVTVAMIDAQFALQHKVLEGIDLRDNWDFVANAPNPWDSLKDGRFSEIHGTSTTGLIASRWEGLPGIAPYASFLLYRAEDNAIESSVEEDNLAAAFVRAVDSGAQIISVSLGYRFLVDGDTVALHPWADYNGKTLVATTAATGAARRNVLVVVAAGNDGRWGAGSIGSPADADSVLAVGAIAEDRLPCGFSSWGPTPDGRMKPDVVAFGCSVPVAGANGPGGIEFQGSGTSFSTPLVAGLAVLARQLLPGATAMELLAKIQASGDSARTPGAAIGNGLPNLLRIKAVNDLLSKVRLSGPPLSWRPGSGPLSFRNSSAQGGGKLELVLSTLSGRIVFRRTGPYQTGAGLWNPSGASSPRPGILVARWWGEYGNGSQSILILPP